jgi:threonine dehydrogenase-like Zn-dependent dehydrogenase
MRVLQIVRPGEAEWTEAPVPQPGLGEVLVKVLGVTTCPHWDIHLMDGDPMFPGAELEYPLTPGQPGHEMVGDVIEIGPGVESPVVGDRVAAWRDRGTKVSQGCYGQYVAFDADCLLVVPRDLEVDAIASLELAMCVHVTFDQLAKFGGVRGKRVGVAGLGPAGLIAVQMARSYGASQVVGIDPLPGRRQTALELGAHETATADEAEFPPGRQDPLGLDVAIDATGLKPAIEFLVDRTREVVAIFGVLRETIELTAARTRGGFALMGYAAHNLGAAERALALIESGDVQLAPLVTHRLPLSQYAEGVALLRAREATKILFTAADRRIPAGAHRRN